MSTARLSRTIWLAAGMDALAADGARALAAEPMSRRLGTTKGSFYWHFKDVPDYHAALLADWHKQTLAHLETLLHEDGTADRRLRDFGHALLQDHAEAALRTWAQTAPAVAARLAEIDAERLRFLTELLRQLGLGNPDFARALMATLAGLPQVSRDITTQTATFDTLVDTVLALS